MANYNVRACSFCGALTPCDLNYPDYAQIACADCMLGRTPALLVDLDAGIIHAESRAVRFTTWCGDPIEGEYARLTTMPLDMSRGQICQWCKAVLTE